MLVERLTMNYSMFFSSFFNPNALLVFFASAGCGIYNLGTGRGTSVLEIVAAFEKASGKV
jgi:nucleoside-diphosphate-sugar epimerase